MLSLLECRLPLGIVGRRAGCEWFVAWRIAIYCSCGVLWLGAPHPFDAAVPAWSAEPAGAGTFSAAWAEFLAAWDDEQWQPNGGRMARYLRALDDGGWPARMKAFQAAVQHRAAAVAELRTHLRQGTASERILAAQVLGHCGDANAIGDLATALATDEEDAVRLYAADSLGMLSATQYGELLSEREKAETNGDTRRHLGYAQERLQHPLEAAERRRLEAWPAGDMNSARLGQPAPDFELTSLGGDTVRLRDFRSRSAVVLVFVYRPSVDEILAELSKL